MFHSVANSDYRPLTTTLIFMTNVLSIDVNVTLIDDDLVEGDEKFRARLVIITSGLSAELFPRDTANVTIIDDDSKKYTLSDINL